MTDNENSVVDPSILFGGSANPVTPANPPAAEIDTSIPDFLRRQSDDTVVVDAGTVAGVEPVGSAVVADTPEVTQSSDQAAVPQFGTAVNEDTGQTEVVVEGAHSDVPAHTPVGHNQPPEDPQTREEMIKDMWKDIGAYGKASGAGAAALPRLGLRVIRAAADGLISNEKPKNGDKSDAVRIYERYAEQDSKHSEHSKGGMKANAAKLNALIGLGCMTTVDGVEVADRAVKLREKMEADDLKPKALFAGLVDVARAQMEEDQPLTDDAIMGALGKTVKDKTLAEEWAAIYKKIEKVISGENSHGIKDQSDRALKIGELVNEHINNFAQDAADEDGIAFCMERGMSRAEAKAFVAKRS